MLSDRDYMRPGASRRFGRGEPSVIGPLIWANVIVYLFQGFGSNRFTNFLALRPECIRAFELWRVATYMFAHAPWTGMLPFHILFNMWALYMLGRPVQQRLGATHFLHLYFISGVIGGLVWLLFNWTPGAGLIGASGAVCGVMMAAVMTAPNMIIYIFPIPIPMRLRRIFPILIGIEVFMAISHVQSGIAHVAHLGGVFGGFLYMRRLRRGTTHRRSGASKRSGASLWQRFKNMFRSTDLDVLDDQSMGFRDEDDEPTAAEIDRILDKIAEHGEQSLSPEERRALEKKRRRVRRDD